MEKLGKTSVNLKEFQESDLEEFYRIAKNKGVKKFVRIFYPEDMEEAKMILDMLRDTTNYISFKILDEDNRIVGGIVGDKIGRGKIDVSYFIGEEYRKNGFCTQAVSLFEQYLKEKSKITTMQFYVARDNKRSQNVMKRLSIKLDHKTNTGIIFEKEIS